LEIEINGGDMYKTVYVLTIVYKLLVKLIAMSCKFFVKFNEIIVL